MTDEYTFQGEPNDPPVILSKTGWPAISSNNWIDKEEQPQWQLEVRVRDENVDQPLRAQWRIVSQDDPEPDFVPQDIQLSFEPIRELPIRVNTAVLLPYRCHKLELAVSGSFPDLPPEPRFFGVVETGDEDDVARAVWWLWEGEGPLTPPLQKAAILDSCETEDVMGTEPQSTAEPAP